MDSVHRIACKMQNVLTISMDFAEQKDLKETGKLSI